MEQTIGEWYKMFEMQVYICCLITSALFCFVTGHLEAFAATAKVLFKNNFFLVVPLPYETDWPGQAWDRYMSRTKKRVAFAPQTLGQGMDTLMNSTAGETAAGGATGAAVAAADAAEDRGMLDGGWTSCEPVPVRNAFVLSGNACLDKRSVHIAPSVLIKSIVSFQTLALFPV